MPGVVHVQAVPRSVETQEDDILGPRADTNQTQHVGERDTRPFGNEGPTLLTRLMRDLRTGRVALQFRQREGGWASNQAIDCETPVRKAPMQQALVRFVFRRVTIYRGNRRDLAAAEFASRRLVGHQEPLGSIGEGLANAVDAAMIGRDQAVSIGEARSDCGRMLLRRTAIQWCSSLY